MNMVLSEIEIEILKIFMKNRGGTARDIYNKLPSGFDFITILRIVHTLHKKGLLLQIRSGSESTYKVSEQGIVVIP